MKRCPVIHMDKLCQRDRGMNIPIEQGLYRALREFDHMGVSVIFSESFADDDRSEAIMNRLLKAAGQKIEYLSDK